jgi:hypothetical protein
LVAEILAKDNGGGCCGGCRNAQQARPRFVVGVFMDVQAAEKVAARLRASTGQPVNVLRQAYVVDAETPIAACSGLYHQISRHLALGASVVVIDAEGPEQQLGVSRLLLESKCDMLLTHDGPRRFD